MQLILLVVHIIISICLISIILIQRNSTDGLSGLSGGGNNAGVLSGRAAANILTKITTILAVLFMINSLILGNFAIRSSKKTSLIDSEQSIKQQDNIEKAPEVPIVD
ncbi:MAG: preprotein translocase subunit SecG [Alphaproteobacteria bacterium]